MFLFADDAKMYCHVRDIVDKDKLQSGIDKFVKRTDKWQVKLNIDKCKVVVVNTVLMYKLRKLRSHFIRGHA